MIVASNLLLDRECGSAYSRQSDFGRGHFGRRVNFNDSDLLELAIARSRFQYSADRVLILF